MSIIKCPVCGNQLDKCQNTYLCKNKHTFDIARQGYVHLLLSNQKNSREPGDSKQMVTARNAFLNAGYFRKLSEAINAIVLENVTGRAGVENLNILDAGCGEGYYIDSLAGEYARLSAQPHLYGMDISREAVRVASSRNKSIFFAVASSFQMPFLSKSMHCILQIFAPCVNHEFNRVLKDEGMILSVIPGKRHLFGLKEILYEKPYENDEMEYPFPSFKKEKQVRVEYNITLSEPEHILHLYQMTPYYWRTSSEKMKELETVSCLETPCEFVITLYSKN